MARLRFIVLGNIQAQRICFALFVAALEFFRLYIPVAGILRDGFAADGVEHVMAAVPDHVIESPGVGLAGRPDRNGKFHPTNFLNDSYARLDEFSKKLLCSYNRIQDAHCALQSFGDADGDRVDCYRYFRLKEQKRLTTKYSVVDKAADGLTQSDLLEAAVKLLMGDEADYRAVEALEQFGYFKGGKPCVPVFMDNDTSIILEIEELLEKHIWESVRELFSNLSGLNITAMANGVPVDEIANECWHILFGCINEKLIVDGFVACPDFYQDEGRYLKCIEFYKE